MLFSFKSQHSFSSEPYVSLYDSLPSQTSSSKTNTHRPCCGLRGGPTVEHGPGGRRLRRHGQGWMWVARRRRGRGRAAVSAKNQRFHIFRVVEKTQTTSMWSEPQETQHPHSNKTRCLSVSVRLKELSPAQGDCQHT